MKLAYRGSCDLEGCYPWGGPGEIELKDNYTFPILKYYVYVAFIPVVFVYRSLISKVLTLTTIVFHWLHHAQFALAILKQMPLTVRLD